MEVNVMEKEISNGAMLGIVLIALAAIIGLGFGVFAIAKGTANEGVTGVQENLGAVSNSAFTDYDQKIVTGTQVMSAVQNFEGKPVAILISTIATRDAQVAEGALDMHDGPGVKEAYSSRGGFVPGVAAYSDSELNEAYKIEGYVSGKAEEIKAGDASFINYNALLNGTVSEATDNKGQYTKTNIGKMYFDSNCFRSETGYATSAGKVQFNNITGNMSKSGMMEYVPSGARFQGYLIKDASGTIMGVAFEQLNTR